VQIENYKEINYLG